MAASPTDSAVEWSEPCIIPDSNPVRMLLAASGDDHFAQKPPHGRRDPCNCDEELFKVHIVLKRRSIDYVDWFGVRHKPKTLGTKRGGVIFRRDTTLKQFTDLLYDYIHDRFDLPEMKTLPRVTGGWLKDIPAEEWKTLCNVAPAYTRAGGDLVWHFEFSCPPRKGMGKAFEAHESVFAFLEASG